MTNKKLAIYAVSALELALDALTADQSILMYSKRTPLSDWFHGHAIDPEKRFAYSACYAVAGEEPFTIGFLAKTDLLHLKSAVLATDVSEGNPWGAIHGTTKRRTWLCELTKIAFAITPDELTALRVLCLIAESVECDADRLDGGEYRAIQSGLKTVARVASKNFGIPYSVAMDVINLTSELRDVKPGLQAQALVAVKELLASGIDHLEAL
jgi:hypothetical protein